MHVSYFRFATTETLVAEFDARGLRGQVGFIDISSRTFRGQGLVNVTSSLKGTIKGEMFVWKVYSNPVLPHESCTPHKYGPVFLDFSESHGLLVSDARLQLGDVFLEDLVERTLVLKSVTTLRVVCGILRPTSRVTTFSATFVKGVTGNLLIRQVNEDPGHTCAQREDGRTTTGILSSLVTSFGVDLDSPRMLTWRLFSRKYEAEDESLKHMLEQCRSLGSFPGTLLHEGLYPFPLANGLDDARHYELEPVPSLLSLVGQYSVLVVLYEGEQVEACSVLHRVKPKRASAVFNNSRSPTEVTGQVGVYQVSPLDPVKLSINLSFPLGNAMALGVDQLPTEDRTSCSGLSLRFHESSDLELDLDLTPAPQQGTPDLYPTGDWSGKFGTLLGLEFAAATVTDTTSTLFGTNSVLGRSVVVYDELWRVLGCANLEDHTPKITARASFSKVVEGELVLSQPTDSFFSETQILLKVNKTAGTEASFGHRWHIHSGQVDSDSDCASPGPHFNPYGASPTQRQQFGEGIPDTTFEVGDLQGKHGPLTLPAAVDIKEDPSTGRWLWTDSNLPLLGVGSVITRTFVMHGKNGDAGSLVCATIEMEELVV
ncbi:uncharacterized protein LOC143032687 [Oratosquilla oratoria]|uniref:uncharacterized protein LOC143032687 n=1 Tax=Oratosquilla oratoria TaxID=337810 RepID=UPI003F768581